MFMIYYFIRLSGEMEEHEGLKIPSVFNRVQVQVLSELQIML